MNKFDIGIYGLWYGHNYGSIITYYALSNIIEMSGKRCAMIDNPLRTEKDIESLRRSHPLKFAIEHYEIAPSYSIEEMKQLNGLFDTFIIGSDQMWNYDLSKPYEQSYFLDFTDIKKKKYSYAVSFGKEKYTAPNDEIIKVKENLAKFSSISVRDDFSKQILEDVFGLGSQIVVDPVFICPIEKYDNLITEAHDFHIREEYIFAYILDPNIVIGDNLSRIADEMNISIYVCFNESGDKESFKSALGAHSERVICLEDPTVQEWLYLMRNAECVITDSYHGACFSMIYDKPFVVKKNMRRGGRRFEHLLSTFELKQNMVDNPAELFSKVTAINIKGTIDYNVKNSPAVKESMAWFKDNIV